MPAPLSPVVQALRETCDAISQQLCWADVTATLHQLQGGLGMV